MDENNWLTPQVVAGVLQAVVFLIAVVVFLWKVPSKDDINSLKTDLKDDIRSLREDLREVRQNFTDHLLHRHTDQPSAKQENSKSQGGEYSVSNDTQAQSESPSDD